jgi:hypothetical protein
MSNYKQFMSYQVQPGETAESLRADHNPDPSMPTKEQHSLTSPKPQGVQRVVVGADGGMEYTDVGATHRGKSGPDRDAADVWSTLRTQSGRALHRSEATDDALITFRGIDMTVRSALMAGILDRDTVGGPVKSNASATGSQTPMQQQQQQPEKTEQQQSDDAGGEALDADGEATVTMLSQSTAQSTQISAVREAVTNGAVSDATIARAATEAGMEPSQVRQMVDDTMAKFAGQAAAAIEASGFDAQEVIAWAQTEKAGDLQQAMRDLPMQRSTAGFKALADAYFLNLDTANPDALLGAQLSNGGKIVKVGGRLCVDVPGRGPVFWRAAVSSGLVSLDRGKAK